MNEIDEFLKPKFDALNIKFLEAYPHEAEGLYKYISWWIREEDGKSVLYFDLVLLSDLSDISFQDEVKEVFRQAKNLK